MKISYSGLEEMTKSTSRKKFHMVSKRRNKNISNSHKRLNIFVIHSNLLLNISYSAMFQLTLFFSLYYRCLLFLEWCIQFSSQLNFDFLLVLVTRARHECIGKTYMCTSVCCLLVNVDENKQEQLLSNPNGKMA